MEGVHGLQGRLCWKINHIWSISTIVSKSAYEIFSPPSYKDSAKIEWSCCFLVKSFVKIYIVCVHKWNFFCWLQIFIKNSLCQQFGKVEPRSFKLLCRTKPYKKLNWFCQLMPNSSWHKALKLMLFVTPFWVYIAKIWNKLTTITTLFQKVIDKCKPLEYITSILTNAASNIESFVLKGSMTLLQALQISMKFLLQIASDMRRILWKF